MSEKDPVEKGSTRRALLKSGALASVPLILSLRPDEARAAGSWSHNAQKPYPSAPGTPPPPSPGRPRYVVPFSNEWRHQKTQTLQQSQQDHRRYGGVGN